MKTKFSIMHKYLFVLMMAFAMVACQKKGGEKVSFIDSETQAFSEKVLRNQMDRVDASSGALAVMEVSTGNIIAWVELTKRDSLSQEDGESIEEGVTQRDNTSQEVDVTQRNNKSQKDSVQWENSHLLQKMMEPGTLFLPVSLMIALEDKKVQLGDTVDTGGGIWQFFGNNIKDHNFMKGGYGIISAE